MTEDPSGTTPTPATLRLYTETEDQATVALIARRHRNYPERFKTMFQSSFHRMAEWDRPAVYHRVLWALLAELDPIQFRAFSHREIREATGLSMAGIEKAMKMLQADRMILTKGHSSARRIRLNNNLAWASTSEKFHHVERDPMPEDSRGR